MLSLHNVYEKLPHAFTDTGHILRQYILVFDYILDMNVIIDFKKLSSWIWLSRIILCTNSGSLSLICFRQCGSHVMTLTHIQVLVGQGLCRL